VAPHILEEVSGQLHSQSALPPREEPPILVEWEEQSGLDFLEKRKISCPCWESNSGYPDRHCID
jgi:hypothetical protein